MHFRSSKEHGFTLIELMVVLIILSVSAGMAMLALGKGTERNLFDTRDRTIEWLNNLSAHASLENRSYRLSLINGKFDLALWNENDWLDVRDIELPTIPNTIVISAVEESVQADNYLFLPTGQVTPTIKLVFSDADQSVPVVWPAGERVK